MARVRAGPAAAALLAPVVAWAQDATVLAVAFGPPLLVAPFLAQYVRARWLLPRNGTSAPRRAWIAAGIVEGLLWVFVGYLAAMVVFDERWLALILLVAGLAALLFTLRALGAPHRSWGFTLAMLAVFPAVMAVAMVFSLAIAFMFG
jgi:hypothetical protein